MKNENSFDYINPEIAKQTVDGPGDLVLRLDASEIYPDDPGMGTPRLLELKRETMTLDCAMDNSPDMGCNEEQTEWIHAICDEADAWLDAQYEVIRSKS